MFNFAQIRWGKKIASVGGFFHFKLMSLVGPTEKSSRLKSMSAI